MDCFLRSIAEPLAHGRFVALASTQAEMRRKGRTFLRSITVLLANLDLLNPLRHGRFAFQLASHKLLRFVVPFLLLTTLTTTGRLRGEPIYVPTSWAQASFYLPAVVAGVASAIPAESGCPNRLLLHAGAVRYARGADDIRAGPATSHLGTHQTFEHHTDDRP